MKWRPYTQQPKWVSKTDTFIDRAARANRNTKNVPIKGSRVSAGWMILIIQFVDSFHLLNDDDDRVDGHANRH